MTVASIAASAAGVEIGGRGGFGTAILGIVVGLVVAGLSVFLLNWALMIVTRARGRDPRKMENRLTAQATWGVAAAAGLAVIGAAIGLY